MSFTIDENGTALTETQGGVTMPVDCSFEKVNDWVHGVDVQFEELQALCLGMANENDKIRALLKEAGDYLDINNLTSIGSGSILHQKFKDAANT